MSEIPSILILKKLDKCKYLWVMHN